MALIDVSAEHWWGNASESEQREVIKLVAADYRMSEVLGAFSRQQEREWFEAEAKARRYTQDCRLCIRCAHWSFDGGDLIDSPSGSDWWSGCGEGVWRLSAGNKVYTESFRELLLKAQDCDKYKDYRDEKGDPDHADRL